MWDDHHAGLVGNLNLNQRGFSTVVFRLALQITFFFLETASFQKGLAWTTF